jgi:hypothetical protein
MRHHPLVARDLITLALAFLAGTVLAEALGATNLGTALAFGQIAFAATLVWVLVRGSPERIGREGEISREG